MCGMPCDVVRIVACRPSPGASSKAPALAALPPPATIAAAVAAATRAASRSARTRVCRTTEDPTLAFTFPPPVDQPEPGVYPDEPVFSPGDGPQATQRTGSESMP